MEKLIKSILGDLYKLDPKLKKSEKELVPLLQKLVKAKPHIKLDSGFIKNLRHQVVARADELMEAEQPIQSSWFARILAPLMSGSLALAALLIGLMVWNGQLDFARKPEPIPQPTSMALRTALPSTPTEPTTPPEADTFAEPSPVVPETIEPPIVEAPKIEKAPEAAPTKILKREAVKSPTIPEAPKPEEEPASAPMMLMAEPEGEAAEAVKPESAPTFGAKSMDAAAGVSNVGVDPIAYALSALKRAQSGERKITATTAQIGYRSPQEMMSLNFDNLPAGFTELVGALPAGYKAFVDYAGPTPQYYIYFESTYQWYGPF